MAVFRHRQWVRTLHGTIDASANRPFGKNHRGKHKCVGGFASQQRGTHLQVTLGYVEKSPLPENCHLAPSDLLCSFFVKKIKEIPGTPASRPLFVPPGVPGTPSLSLCALLFPENSHHFLGIPSKDDLPAQAALYVEVMAALPPSPRSPSIKSESVSSFPHTVPANVLLLLVNFTLPGLRFHVPPNTSVFLPRPVTPLHAPFLAWPRPFLARSSPGPRPALARSSPGPRPASPGPRPPSFQAI